MIRLEFHGMVRAHSIELGPAKGFRVAGNFLRQLPENQVLGEYIRHQWRVRDGHFTRYDTLEPCRVYFEDAEGTRSEVFGPYDRMHVADGTMYTNEELFAKFIDETVLWHAMEIETYWPSVIIVPASGELPSATRSAR